ncbi:MAG: DoxX family protein [Cyclobacteriaceae bacterium]
MNALTTIVARLLFAVPLAVFGLFHFMGANEMAGMVPSFIPGGVIWVYITGAALLAASLSIIINKQAKLACLLLGIMLLIFALTIHLPAMENQVSMTMLLKDVALAGAAFAFSGILKN